MTTNMTETLSEGTDSLRAAQAAVTALEDENERLREVLEFYAKEANWRYDLAPEPINVPIPGTAVVDSDCGQLARRALEASHD